MAIRYLVMILCFGNFFSERIYAQNNESKINYEYKKYEKFDFGDMLIQGNNGGIGDLSINPRFKIDFKNQLPKKKNFHREMMDSVDSLL